MYRSARAAVLRSAPGAYQGTLMDRLGIDSLSAPLKPPRSSPVAPPAGWMTASRDGLGGLEGMTTTNSQKLAIPVKLAGRRPDFCVRRRVSATFKRGCFRFSRKWQMPINNRNCLSSRHRSRDLFACGRLGSIDTLADTLADDCAHLFRLADDGHQQSKN